MHSSLLFISFINVKCLNFVTLNFVTLNFITTGCGVRLPLSEDPALAMAFSVARRAAAVPLLLVNGTYRKNIHTYLDSSILQYQLQRLNEHGSLKGSVLPVLFLSRHFLIYYCVSVFHLADKHQENFVYRFLAIANWHFV